MTFTELNIPDCISDFDFDLPDELIAQTPLNERSASRLLIVQGLNRFSDRHFVSVLDQIRDQDCVIFNDTRVIKARLFGHKDSGGKVEILVERIIDPHRVLVHLRASHRPQPQQKIFLSETLYATVGGVSEQGLIELVCDQEWLSVLHDHGNLPLPPYITHSATAEDEARYQTVFAAHDGAVAAPTAGLHFDQALLAQLKTRGIAQAFVTLHVGAGTFQPIRVDDLSQHVMHTERYSIPRATVETIAATRARGGRVIAVGTTSLRALESAADDHHKVREESAETRLFIRPGYQFGCVDALITNFHLPKSSLLVLVSAFAGYEVIRASYAHAIAQKYRFFSYGDAMWLERAHTNQYIR